MENENKGCFKVVKRSTLERAKQMNIEVIIFDGYIEKFRKKLEYIIMRNEV